MQFCIAVVMLCMSRHLQPTIVESALCCPCLELLFSLGSQTACTQCTSSTLPGVIVPGTGSQPSYTASPNRLRFTLQQKIALAAHLLLMAFLLLLSNYQTIAIGQSFFSAIELSEYGISYWRIQETIGSSPQSIGLSDIGLKKKYRLPTSAI